MFASKSTNLLSYHDYQTGYHFRYIKVIIVSYANILDILLPLLQSVQERTIKTRPKIIHSNPNDSKNAMSCYVVVHRHKVLLCGQVSDANAYKFNVPKLYVVVVVVGLLCVLCTIKNSVTQFPFFCHKQNNITLYIAIAFVCLSTFVDFTHFKLFVCYYFKHLTVWHFIFYYPFKFFCLLKVNAKGLTVNPLEK